jgi:hypothetical protein
MDHLASSPPGLLADDQGVYPEQIIKTWGDDAMAVAVLKVAQSPTSTATYPQLQAPGASRARRMLWPFSNIL